VTYRDVTREAVLKAIDECGRLGHDEFLAKYGFDHARSYFLVHEGKRYDSKAIVGVAHGFLPGQDPLTPKTRGYSGGKATVGRHLRKLGFVVEVGGQPVGPVARRLTKLSVYYSNGLPALYQPITLLWAISRASRGEPRLVSWEETVADISALIECYGRPEETARIYYPVAALFRAGLWDIKAGSATVPSAHGSSVPQQWFAEHRPLSGLVDSVYSAVQSGPGVCRAVVNALLEKYFLEAPHAALLNELGLLDSPAERAFDEAAEYRRLCGRADAFWEAHPDPRALRTSNDPVRSKAARRAVILRSKGKCENPECTSGDIPDVTDKGEPLLEVDHVKDLGLDGDDKPVQMIALCPNCHKLKTHGRTREQLRQKLYLVAERLHREMLSPS
jgi:5-methylcytosine-specific restriction protein A